MAEGEIVSCALSESHDTEGVNDKTSQIDNDVHKPVNQLSKNQQKKLRKQEMRKQHWKEKRKLERERRKEKRKQAKQEGVILPPDRKKLRSIKMDHSSCDITVVIDSSYESYMNENDIKKLTKQIQRCYAINRRASQQFQYYVTSYGGKVEDRIVSLEGSSSWDIKFEPKKYFEVFKKENIVYLSSESENVLETLESGKIYVIGGLVDHNSQKGLCHRLATENKIAHAQLPISQYIDLKSRRVLTIDHVFEILSKFNENKDWEAAFFSVIPKRKGAKCKEKSDEESDD